MCLLRLRAGGLSKHMGMELLCSRVSALAGALGVCKDPEIRESKMNSGNKAKICKIEHKGPPYRAQNQEGVQFTKASTTDSA